jgi:hypothetical protein
MYSFSPNLKALEKRTSYEKIAFSFAFTTNGSYQVCIRMIIAIDD